MGRAKLLLAAVFGLFTMWQIGQTPVSAAPISCTGRAYMVRSEDIGASSYSQLYEIIDNGTSVDISTVFNAPTGLTDGGVPINDTAVFTNGYVLNALGFY